jgi:ABC-type bacteriocin/lantibiotic exporter with double-glycine peptidase domain
MSKQQITRYDLARNLVCPSLFIMLTLMVIEALLAALVTWLVIQAGRKVANDQFVVTDLVWILTAQSTSYVVGVISWVFAERAGCRAFGLFMMRFARENHGKVKLLNEKPARERVEPFLTGETYHCFFNLMYEIEFALKIFLALVFNSIVLGSEIDVSLPIAYLGAFAALLIMQWTLRKPISNAYLENQRQTNRVTAQGYTAWDNIFSGNRYNLRLWLGGFKSRLRDALRAQIRAIVAREGLSAMSGIVSLAIVFATMTYVAARNADDTVLLIALATTLPRQIEMTYELHLLASGWNEFVAVWTRFRGVADNMLPQPDQKFDGRIKFDKLVLKIGDSSQVISSVNDALQIVFAEPTGRINVRGANGSGKSTLLASLKTELRKKAYYWPTSDRLAYQFSAGVDPIVVSQAADDEEDIVVERKQAFSSGERQIRSLQEIVEATEGDIYLLDEWDANLDPNNRARAETYVNELASRARVVEISHRDRVG